MGPRGKRLVALVFMLSGAWCIWRRQGSETGIANALVRIPSASPKCNVPAQTPKYTGQPGAPGTKNPSKRSKNSQASRPYTTEHLISHRTEENRSLTALHPDLAVCVELKLLILSLQIPDRHLLCTNKSHCPSIQPLKTRLFKQVMAREAWGCI